MIYVPSAAQWLHLCPPQALYTPLTYKSSALVLKVVKILLQKIKRKERFSYGGLFESITVFKFFAARYKVQQEEL